jgi:hypothetical protein
VATRRLTAVGPGWQPGAHVHVKAVIAGLDPVMLFPFETRLAQDAGYAGASPRIAGGSPSAADAAPGPPYFISQNSVGVLPVTWRKACENAGTLA